jgi:hypothetical protein
LVNETNIGGIRHILLHIGDDAAASFLASPIALDDMIDLSLNDPKDGHKPKFSFGDDNYFDIIDRSSRKEEKKKNESAPYPMARSPRGYCLLINNFFTVGTFKEMQRFRNIFYQLHFDVIMKKNLGAIEIRDLLIEISRNEELDKHDAFIFMIITHGNEKKEIAGFDGYPLNVHYLMNLMDEINCPYLKGRPKVFIFNCCQSGEIFYFSNLIIKFN